LQMAGHYYLILNHQGRPMHYPTLQVARIWQLHQYQVLLTNEFERMMALASVCLIAFPDLASR
jgi:hypothetical protein